MRTVLSLDSIPLLRKYETLHNVQKGEIRLLFTHPEAFISCKDGKKLFESDFYFHVARGRKPYTQILESGSHPVSYHTTAHKEFLFLLGPLWEGDFSHTQLQR